MADDDSKNNGVFDSLCGSAAHDFLEDRIQAGQWTCKLTCVWPKVKQLGWGLCLTACHCWISSTVVTLVCGACPS